MVSLIPFPPAGRVGRPTSPQTQADKRPVEVKDRNYYYPPPPPHENILPADSVLYSLIQRALEALSKGIYWDRGSIINLLL